MDFERQFGGLRFLVGPAGEKQEFKLGIEWHEPRPKPGDKDDPERTMVPIGWGWNEYEQLFMNERGEVVSSFDTISMKSSSIVRYIEQLAIGLTPRWKPPSFTVVLRPALGERLARALALRCVEEASDEYKAWWRGHGLFLQQVLFPASWQAGHTTIQARSIDDAVRAIEMAGALEPGLMVEVGSNPLKMTRPTKSRRAHAPSIDAWASVPGARRYPYANESPHMKGAVWMLKKRGTHIIEQYRVYEDEDGEQELLAWDTFKASGGTSRDMEG
ncbi:hypothetical protein [Polyangium sp. 6x1]|uniref:hypothetical protein n=1 Tax=Polyangium sp. 6x1 TaxID=3042689 RepID=UPI0024832BE0|nr:hypothetical protein [Polyangium sp. 6x1]MDI1443570.1 hypothetical protein [Polyangium sp. 6x1]